MMPDKARFRFQLFLTSCLITVLTGYSIAADIPSSSLPTMATTTTSELPFFRSGFEEPAGDSDGDGLDDDVEDHLGTDPNNPDTDGDGLEDGEEVIDHKTDPNKKDTDGDGAGDWLEILKGTDPRDPNDFPASNVPVNPKLVAPELMQGEATTVKDATAFLYDGPVPVQTGVNPDDIKAQRAALIRGKVFERSGGPLAAVRVSILNRPEFGQTFTREDGMFDLVVNGGGKLIVNYELQGYAPAQRHVTAAWNEWASADDVALVPLDPVATEIDLSQPAPFQVARASVQTDADGSRQATLLFPVGTTAEMMMPDGSTQALSTLTVRATEYTVGEDGPAAMPAPLPATNTYTYAAELSVDEAIAAGAADVRFNQPVFFYIENFIDLPAGSIVPVGFYNETSGIWEAADDGLVIDILSETEGKADIDFDGDGIADDPTDLVDEIGLSDAERAQLAATYEPGDSVWRASTTHFSTIDCNHPPRPELRPPGERTKRRRPRDKDDDGTPEEDPCEQGGSIIECQTRVLRERVPVVGTDVTMNYRSDRSNESYEFEVRITPDELPFGSALGMTKIVAIFEVAGTREERSYSPQLGVKDTFVWDGFDVYGRRFQGTTTGSVSIYFDYPATYLVASGGGSGGGGGGGSDGGNRSFGSFIAREVIDYPGRGNGLRFGRRIPVEFESAIDPRVFGTGGWTPSIHHSYDVGGTTLYLGDGSVHGAKNVNTQVFEPFYGGSNVSLGAFDFTEDGTAYFAYRQLTFAKKNGIYVKYSDERAQELGFNGQVFENPNNARWVVTDLEIGLDGNIWFVAYEGSVNDRIYQLGYMTPDGDLTFVVEDFNEYPAGLAIDPMGGFYVSQTNANQVLYFSPSLMASGQVSASDARVLDVFAPWPTRLAVDNQGRLYVVTRGQSLPSIPSRILRIDIDSKMTVVAGGGNGTKDGTHAVDYYITVAQDVYPDDEGGFYFADINTVHYVDAAGFIRTVAGGGTGNARLDEPWRQDARSIDLDSADSVGIGPGDEPFVTVRQSSRRWLTRLGRQLPGFGSSSIVIASPDADRLYEFSRTGRHLRTKDATTRQTLFTFDYDNKGRLRSITDKNGENIQFEHNNGVMTGLRAPGGQLTTATIGANDWLTGLGDTAGNSWTFDYDLPNARLVTLLDRNGQLYQYTYDDGGAFVSELGPDSSTLSLSHSADEEAGWFEVVLTDRNSLQTTYRREYDAGGNLLFTNTHPEGGVTTIGVDRQGLLTRTMPTGTEFEVRRVADLRFSMDAPTSVGRVTTPAGRSMSFESSRTTTLEDYNDPLSVKTLTSSWRMGSRTITSLFDKPQKNLTLTYGLSPPDVFEYDDGWNLSSVTRAGLSPQVFNWSDEGKLLSTSIGNESLTFTYDEFGKLGSVQNALGMKETYGRDDVGNLSSITLPGGELLTTTYDANGNRTRLTMPSGDIHEMTYTAVNQLASYKDPLGNETSMSYDIGRRRTLTKHPSGVNLVNSFDDAGRIDSVSYASADLGFTYQPGTTLLDTLSRSDTVYEDQSVTYSWDGHLPAGLVFAGAASGSFTYDYDNDLRIDSIQLDANPALVDTYNGSGVLTGHGPFQLTRDTQSNLPTQWSDGNGQLNFEYDGLGRITRRWNEVNGVVIYDLQVTWNTTDKIITRAETVGGVMTSYAYAYNSNGALDSVSINGVPSSSFDYDSNSNRTDINGVAATYDAADRLTDLGGVAYGWDVNGYLLSRGSDTFNYTVRGELMEANINGTVVEYAYDGMGRMTARIEAAGTTQYLYGNPAALHLVTHSRAPDGTLTTYYYDESGLLHAFERDAQTWYVATDQVGSPRIISNSTGVVVREIEYDALGEVLSDSNPALDLVIGYGGGISDPTTGLIRFLLRDYDPVAGRWTARDPAGFEGGMNLYLYANADPVKHRDPTGLFCMGASAYAGVGGGVTGCYENGEWSLCSEVGAGIGGGLDVSPLGKVARTERFVKLKASAGFGPLVTGNVSLKYTDCGRTGCSGGGSCLPTEDLQAGCSAAFVSCGGNGGVPDLQSINKNLQNAKNGEDVFKWSAKASATVGACARF